MIIKQNQDNSFFAVKSDKIPLDIMTKDVKSISITEEAGKMVTGNIEFLDRNNTYINMFQYEAEIEIAFGYKSGIALSNVFENISSIQQRTGLRALLMSPSHSIKDNGEKITKYNFKSGYGMNLDRQNVNHDGKTRGQIVREIFTNDAIKIQFVNFKSMDEKVNVRQVNEPNFAFLRRMSRKWKTRFVMALNSSGESVGMFCDESVVDEAQLKLKIIGIPDSADYLFEWGSGLSNVYSAECKQNVGESGSGDIVKLVLIDGEVVKQQSSASVKRFQTVKLDTALMKADMKRIQQKEGYAAATKFYSSIVQAKEISDPKIARYWIPVQHRTAPDTAGVEVSLKCRGNPLYIPASQAVLGKGFPDFYRTIFYSVRTITHEIGAKYSNTILLKDRLYA